MKLCQVGELNGDLGFELASRMRGVDNVAIMELRSNGGDGAKERGRTADYVESTISSYVEQRKEWVTPINLPD